MSITAPITYIPNFCEGDVESLWNEISWVNIDTVPRYECWMNDYGVPYSYGSGTFSRTYEPIDWYSEADNIRNFLKFKFDFDCCFINGYINEKQHLGWHSDDSPEMSHDHPIAVVSFGEEREIWFRNKYEPEVVEKLLLENGSFLLMHPNMQRDWEHRIPKCSRNNIGKRISFTYRKLVV